MPPLYRAASRPRSYRGRVTMRAGSWSGTEMPVLTTHAGKLYGGNGYWEDQPGPEGLQGAEILTL